MYDSDCGKVKFQLVRNTVIGCNGSKALVTMDPYNSLEANIHKDLVGSRGSFMLVINDQQEDHYENKETTFGRSQKIVSVTTSYAILNRIIFMFVKLLLPHIYLCVY